MDYKLIVVNNFKDIHTDEEYTIGQELNVSEERAFELFSSADHLVKFVSRDGNLEEISADNEALKAENETLKVDVEKLKSENENLKNDVEKLKSENENLAKANKTTNVEDKDKDKNTSNK